MYSMDMEYPVLRFLTLALSVLTGSIYSSLCLSDKSYTSQPQTNSVSVPVLPGISATNAER